MQIEGIDSIDNRILEVIKDNARLSYREIGEQVGISRVSVKTRMDAMREKGVIRGFQTVIDPTGVPEGTRFFLDVDCESESYEDVVHYLASNRMIRRIYGVSGNCRIHAEGFANNRRNLEVFANTVYRYQHGVRRLEFHTVLTTIMDIDGGVGYVRYQEDKYRKNGREQARETAIPGGPDRGPEPGGKGV